MKIHAQRENETLAKVTASLDAEELSRLKTKALKLLARNVKVAGFRNGKAPLEVVEKNIQDQHLQTEVLNEAINTSYIDILKSENLRPVSSPEVTITKFVPYTELEFELTVNVVGSIVLGDYKKLKVKRIVEPVTDEELNVVLDNLSSRVATKKAVDRAAKSGDEATIDFSGVDESGNPIQGAEGQEYPLLLGSKSFIPGFEDNVIGMKKGEVKEFDVVFPSDYGAKQLQNAKVTFTVTLKELNELELPKRDDEFAKKIGPFETIAALKSDITTQLAAEKEQKADRDYEAAVIDALIATSKVTIPKQLEDEQVEAIMQEVRQNVIRRGMTMDEYYASLDIDAEDYKERDIVPEAQRRIKAGLLLSEVADKEGVDISNEELTTHIEALKSQYSDPTMRSELDKPENHGELRARLRSTKVMKLIVSLQN